jgi:hypothetical protein
MPVSTQPEFTLEAAADMTDARRSPATIVDQQR